MPLSVLRLGHRIYRDQRLTTHVFLSSRALGASQGFYTGQKDTGMEESISRASSQWGGSFTIRYVKSPLDCIKNFPGLKVHLTVYGLPFQNHIQKIRKKKDVLLIVGGEKVTAKVYEKVDWNLSVGSQPHSEVASLSLFLDRYFKGKELNKKFTGAKTRIVPQKRGKKVIRNLSKN